MAQWFLDQVVFSRLGLANSVSISPIYVLLSCWLGNVDQWKNFQSMKSGQWKGLNNEYTLLIKIFNEYILIRTFVIILIKHFIFYYKAFLVKRSPYEYKLIEYYGTVLITRIQISLSSQIFFISALFCALWNRFLWHSTTCNKYWYYSSSLVRELLYSVARATPLSALSLTELSALTTYFAVW